MSANLSPEGRQSVISLSGRYEPFATLGRGGMADVYLATTSGLAGFSKLVVIKMLRPEFAREPSFREMFLHEARLAARLNHPNVVNTFEVGEQAGIYFIAMEYLEGQPLNRVLSRARELNRPLHHSLVARIAADTLTGLRYAHTLRDYSGAPLSIIHRDVSPHNIFVTYEGHVKLVDFGIAKAAIGSAETEVGVLKGKVTYMAPEQAFGGPIDARADLFSVGVVLWEMLTRQRLMDGKSAVENLHRLINEGIPRASTVAQGVPRELDEITAKALEKNADDRFASAGDMLDALEHFLAGSGRPVRQDELGALLVGLFDDVRKDVQARIRRHIARREAMPLRETDSAVLATEHLTASGSRGLMNLGSARVGSSASPIALPRASAPPDAATAPVTVPPDAAGETRAFGRAGQAGQRGQAGHASDMGETGSHPHSSSLSTPPFAPPKRYGHVAFWGLALGCAVVAYVVASRVSRLPVPNAGPLSPVRSADGTLTSWQRPPVPSAAAAAAGPAESARPTPRPLAAQPVLADGGAEARGVAAASAGRGPERGAERGPERGAERGPERGGEAPLDHGPRHDSRPASSASAGHVPQPSRPSEAKVPPPLKAADEATGFLTLDTYPWTRVSVDGKSVGDTPLFKVPLPPGVHTVKVENSEQRLSQTLSLTIVSGETLSKRIGLK